MVVSPGRAAGVAIVALWLGLLAAHLERSWARDEAVAVPLLLDEPADGPARVIQRGVYYRGARIGFFRERRGPSGDGWRVDQRGRFVLNVLGRERGIRIEAEATFDADGTVERFRFRLGTESELSVFDTTVEGRVEGPTLVLDLDSSGRRRTERRRLDGPLVLPLNLYPSLAARGLEPGRVFRTSLLDPMTLSAGEARIEVHEPEIVRWGGVEEEAYRVTTHFAGLSTTAWITAEGELVKEETPLGWTLLKEPVGRPLDADAAARGPDVVSAAAIPALGFAGPSEGLRRARLRLRRFPTDGAALDGGRQRLVAPDELLVTVETIPPPAEPLAEADRARWLAADPFVEADDTAIRETARSLTEGLGPVDAARAINDWVYRTVRKTPTLSIPSAREVLERRAGDCNEHTVLYAALARAAGLPTRIAVGVAYTGGRFYYHAWPEVWVGGWLAVDPTFGQFPADPLHVRVLTGGLDGQLEILDLLERRPAIEVLEVE